MGKVLDGYATNYQNMIEKFKYDLVVMLHTTTCTEDKALAVKLLANVIWLQIKGDGSKYRHWNRL